MNHSAEKTLSLLTKQKHTIIITRARTPIRFPLVVKVPSRTRTEINALSWGGRRF